MLRLMPNVRQTAALVAPASTRDHRSKLFGIDSSRPPAATPATARRSEAGLNALLDQRPFELRQCTEDVEQELALRVVVSICSVSERKAMPRFLRSVTVARRCVSDRPSRSSFQTTRQSSGRRNASAFARPVRSPRLPLAWSSNR